MKKRLIAMLLVLCTVIALLAGMSVTASAENDISADTLAGYVVSYTMVKDDTVAKVCKKLGIDFYKYQSDITKINNIADYSAIPVGKVLWLPATEVGSAENYYTLKTHKISANDTLTGLCAKYGISTGDVLLNRLNANASNLVVGATITFPVYTGAGNGLGVSSAAATDSAAAAAASSSTSTGSTATTISAGTSSLAAGDTIAYYLIPYTMQSGDTVANVCGALGISFNANQALITRVNNITNYSRVPVGRTILLPSATPGSGTCYKVISHTLVSGEYVYALCSSYGISFASNQALLKALNNTSYLESVKAGNQFLIPVSGTFSGTGTGIGSGVTGNGTGTETLGAVHNLTKANATNGSFSLKVDGVDSTMANAGKTVTVACTGETGYVQTEINVYKTGAASTTVAVTNNTFVMPDYDVTVKVTFSKSQAYAVTMSATDVYPNGSATYVLRADGNIVTDNKAYAGSTMAVEVSPKVQGYIFDELRVEKADDETVVVSTNGATFTMPNYAVKIKVYMKEGTEYEYAINMASALPTDAKATYVVKADGNVVTNKKAKAGSTVTVEAKANAAGYVFDEIRVEKADDSTTTVAVKGNSFVMPNYNVKLLVYMKKSGDYEYNLSGSVAAGSGSFNFKVGNTVVSKAKSGAKVTVAAAPASGFAFESISASYTDANGIVRQLVVSGSSFTMPAYPVTVKVNFVNSKTHTITLKTDSTYKASIYTAVLVNGADVSTTKIAMGKEVYVYSKDSRYEVSEISIYKTGAKTPFYTSAGLDQAQRFTYSWDYDITIVPTFKLASSNTIKFSGTNTVLDITYSGKTESFGGTGTISGTVLPGANVLVNLTAGAGYSVAKVSGSYEYPAGVSHAISVPVSGSFKMPAGPLTINVTAVSAKTYTLTGNPASDVKFYVNNENEAVTSAVAGDIITAAVTVPTGKTMKKLVVSFVDANGKIKDVTLNGKTFTMPAGNVTATVSYEGEEFTLSTSTTGLSFYSNNEMTTVTKATAGDLITIGFTGHDGDKVKKLTVTYVDEKDNNKVKTVAVSGNTFTMPAGKVTANATFESVAFKISCSSADTVMGALNAYSGSTVITTAAAGSTVTLKAVPANGYVLEKIVFTDAFGKSVSATYPDITTSPASITMPGYDIKAIAYFTSNTKMLSINTTGSGSVGISVNGKTVASGDMVNVGDIVNINTVADKGYVLDELDVFATNAMNSKVTVSNGQFTMPAFPVTVKATFRAVVKAKVQLDLDNISLPSGCSLAVVINGVQAPVAADGIYEVSEGDEVKIVAFTTGGHVVSKVTVTVKDTGDDVVMLSSNSFTMIPNDVKVIVTFD